MIQDDILVKTNPLAALAQMRSLGATRVRVGMEWDSVETSKGHYDFSLYNAIDQAAAADKISIYFMLTGPAPRWQTGSHADRGVAAGTWKPSTRGFGGLRQGRRHAVQRPSRRAPGELLVDLERAQLRPEPVAADHRPQHGADRRRALPRPARRRLVGAGRHRAPPRHDPHRRDRAPRRQRPGRLPGHQAAELPARAVLRRRPLPAACAGRPPRRSAARRRARARTASAPATPALFSASGFAAHLYALQAHPGPPNRPTTVTGNSSHSDPDFADLPQVPALVGTLDRLNRVYGSHTRFPIWNTEYGYRTRPPDKVGIPQSLAAEYLNWAEYISYRQPRAGRLHAVSARRPRQRHLRQRARVARPASPRRRSPPTACRCTCPARRPARAAASRCGAACARHRSTPQATQRAQKVAIQWRKGSKGRVGHGGHADDPQPGRLHRHARQVRGQRRRAPGLEPVTGRELTTAAR